MLRLSGFWVLARLHQCRDHHQRPSLAFLFAPEIGVTDLLTERSPTTRRHTDFVTAIDFHPLDDKVFLRWATLLTDP